MFEKLFQIFPFLNWNTEEEINEEELTHSVKAYTDLLSITNNKLRYHYSDTMGFFDIIFNKKKEFEVPLEIVKTKLEASMNLMQQSINTLLLNGRINWKDLNYRDLINYAWLTKTLERNRTLIEEIGYIKITFEINLLLDEEEAIRVLHDDWRTLNAHMREPVELIEGLNL